MWYILFTILISFAVQAVEGQAQNTKTIFRPIGLIEFVVVVVLKCKLRPGGNAESKKGARHTTRRQTRNTKPRSFHIVRLDAMIQMAMRNGGNVTDEEFDLIEKLSQTPTVHIPTEKVRAQVNKYERNIRAELVRIRDDLSEEQKNSILMAMYRVAMAGKNSHIPAHASIFLFEVAYDLGVPRAYVKELLHADLNKVSADINANDTFDMEPEEDEEEGKTMKASTVGPDDVAMEVMPP